MALPSHVGVFATKWNVTTDSAASDGSDDEDCSQLMPCRLRDFISEVSAYTRNPIQATDVSTQAPVPSLGRQQLSTPHMLTSHPSLLTDSFTLYIKATVILAQVKTFNVNFRLKHARQDVPAADPRLTQEFQALDKLLTDFTENIPKAFNDPTGSKTGIKLDPILYLAHCIPCL